MNDKMYKGKKPRTSGWEQIGMIENDRQWRVFVKENVESGWMTVKVAAIGRAQGKANYWLGWNGKRFSQQQDTFAILQQRPELLHKVERMLEGHSLI